MLDRFKGKTVLVAGGTGGLGKAVSLAFLNELAKVVVTYRHAEEFTALQSTAGARATSLAGHAIDVTDETAVRELTDKLVAAYGHLDVLVNCVGGYAGGNSLWQVESKVFDQMLALNLRSGYVLTRVIVPVMLQQKSGAIVNVASRTALDHSAGLAAYAASKAAAVAMIDSLAADLMGKGIRANSVLPSLIDTEANRKAMPNSDFSKWPKAEDIAAVILFLCSDEARLIHGAAIPVYGNL